MLGDVVEFRGVVQFDSKHHLCESAIRIFRCNPLVKLSVRYLGIAIKLSRLMAEVYGMSSGINECIL